MSTPEQFASPPLTEKWVPLWPLTAPSVAGWKGQWLAEVNYVKGDQVAYGTAFYVAVAPSLGQAPNAVQPLNPYWIKAGDNAGGMIGWWPLDDTGTTVRDLTGNAGVGSFQNVAAITKGVAGPVAPSKCVEMNNGGSGYILVPNTTPLQGLGIEPGWTLAAWVYATATRPTQAAGIISKGAASNVSACLIYGGHDVANGVWAGCFSGGFYRTGGDVALPLNTWVHYAATCGGGTCKLYRNGVEVKTQGVPALPAYQTTNVHIGRDWDGAGGANSHFPGRIDDARAYKQILTPAEILALYNAGPAPY